MIIKQKTDEQYRMNPLRQSGWSPEGGVSRCEFLMKIVNIVAMENQNQFLAVNHELHSD